MEDKLLIILAREIDLLSDAEVIALDSEGAMFLADEFKRLAWNMDKIAQRLRVHMDWDCKRGNWLNPKLH